VTAPDFRTLVETLTDARVEFVVIGGVAMVLHGAPRTTGDLDVCYARGDENLTRLAHALVPLAPYLRGVPPGLPFRLDEKTLRAGLNFTLTTKAGDLDLLGEVTGVGGFVELSADAVRTQLYDREVLVISLDRLERSKQAAGRVKDLGDLAFIAEIKQR
jgi:hypothetical protein